MNLAIVVVSLLPLLIAQAYGSIYITDIRIIPEDIRINDTLIIEANVFNNSDKKIEYPSLCDSPLDAEFDTNIAVEYGVGCLGFSIETLEPFEHATVRGPASGLFYRVVNEGVTKANVTFSYLVDGEEKSVSKGVTFMINGEKNEGNIIGINQTIAINDLEITLLDVEDFRCPIDVVCFWAGDAKLSLAIKKDGYIENISTNLYQPLLINNYAIKIVSLEPERKHDAIIEKSEYRVTFELAELEDSIKFKAYNDKYGILGVLDLSKDQGLVILFKDGKRELLQFTSYNECNRLSSMICLNAGNRYIEIGKDFILIDKHYIPTINVKLI